jgi:hypothetical protein
VTVCELPDANVPPPATGPPLLGDGLTAEREGVARRRAHHRAVIGPVGERVVAVGCRCHGEWSARRECAAAAHCAASTW